MNNMEKFQVSLIARDCIKAMREPTKAMVKAGSIGWDAGDGSPIRPVFDPTDAWQAMIDASLEDN